MSEFEQRDDFEITPEILSNFSTEDPDAFLASFGDEPFYDSEPEEKTIEQIREERYQRQEQKKKERSESRRSAFINYFMPTIALMLLVSTVCYMNSLTFGLIVSYNNEQLGVVENASVVKEATNLIDSRIINKSLDSLENEPQYRVAVVNNASEFKNSTELSRSIIANDATLEDELCGVFVDDDFIGAVTSEETANEVLSSLLEAKKKDAAILGEVKKVEFNSSVVTEVGLYAKDAIVEKAELKNRLVNNIDISYRITVLQEQNVKIRYKTEYKADETKPTGYEKVTTKGVIGEGIATNECVYIDSEKISTEHIKVTATKKPTNEIITVAADSAKLTKDKDTDSTDTNKSSDISTDKSTDTKADTDSDKTADTEAGTDSDEPTDTQTASEKETVNSDSPFIWPTPTCYEVTGTFGYDTETHLHNGLDISGSAAEGAPIVASAAGTVVSVVKDYGNEGLGCYVIIDHGNGYQTTYAQCSDIYVEYGQQVEQGETIAAVGSTGDSTGPHLHFRITENGEFIDPANYLMYR